MDPSPGGMLPFPQAAAFPHLSELAFVRLPEQHVAEAAGVQSTGPAKQEGGHCQQTSGESSATEACQEGAGRDTEAPEGPKPPTPQLLAA